MTKVLIITGPAGEAAGWGGVSETGNMCRAMKDSGRDAEIAFVENMGELHHALKKTSYDIVWSALYHISGKSDTIGMGREGHWIADVLEKENIPYIGPGAATMRAVLHKTRTHDILEKNGVAVPRHFQVADDDLLPETVFPVFVKPGYESCSRGISDKSVVNNTETLRKQVSYIHKAFHQPALVEEYLPGREYTVLMLGNGDQRRFLPGRVEVDLHLFGKYPILGAGLRSKGKIRVSPVTHRLEEANTLARRAVDALGCLDHVRLDMRVDVEGRLKIMEVNGMPGLTPVRSLSPKLFSLHHASGAGKLEDYRLLIDAIVSSALARYGMT